MEGEREAGEERWETPSTVYRGWENNMCSTVHLELLVSQI